MIRCHRGSASKAPRALVVGALLLLALGACGDSSTEPTVPVTVSVSPSQATVDAGGTASFTASVSGTSDAGVTWTTSAGTISGSGSTATFTAPTSAGTVTVTATSVADPSASGSASVTVPPVSVLISPSSSFLVRGESATFSATVTGAADTGVTWSASCGELSADGTAANYTAPDEVEMCVVTATSDLVPEASASGSVEILPDWLVTSTSDDGSGPCVPSECPFRLALAEVHAGSGPVDADGFAVIRFADELAGGTLTLEQALPTITADLRILGPAGGLVTIDASASASEPRRALTFADGNAEVERMRITGGHMNLGGGVRTDGGGRFVFRNVEIVDNHASNQGGGMSSFGSLVEFEEVLLARNEAVVGGGGLLVSGVDSELAARNSRFEDNTARFGGGLSLVLTSQVEIEGGTISRNTAELHSAGFGMVGSGTLVLMDLDIEDNVVQAEQTPGGGGLLQGTVDSHFSDVRIRGNRAGYGGGVALLQTSSLTMTGGEVVANEAGWGRGGGIAGLGRSVTLDGVTVRGNRAMNDGGGGVFVLESEAYMVDTRIEENEANWGGGLLIWASEVELLRTAVEGNTATVSGGALQIVMGSGVSMAEVQVLDNEALEGTGGGFTVFTGSSVVANGITVEGNRARSSGGGIRVVGDASALTLQNFRVVDNVAGHDQELGQGGGLMFQGGEAVTVLLEEGFISGNRAPSGGGGMIVGAHATVRNVTVADNDGGTAGGGIFAATTGAMTLENVTVSGNVADEGAGIRATGDVEGNGLSIVGNVARVSGGGLVAAGATARDGLIEIRNTLLSGNLADEAEDNCRLVGGGQIGSHGYNLSDDPTCEGVFTAAGDLNGADAGVDPEAADHGGFAPTHALNAGSAAIDAGDPGTCPGTDQRGFLRSGTCDIGAFEFEGMAPSTGIGGLSSFLIRESGVVVVGAPSP